MGYRPRLKTPHTRECKSLLFVTGRCQVSNQASITIFEGRELTVEIRLLTERDAEVLWNLRMLALETDPWSFVESPDELRQISIAE
jgi:hypothetical protein